MKKTFDRVINNDFVRFTIGLFKVIVYAFIVIVVAMIVIQRVSKNNLSLGGYQLYTIVSESMHPKYRIGDMILTKTVTMNDVKVGQDLVYHGKEGELANKTIVHKVIDKRKKNGVYTVTTQGLANDLPDPPVYEDQLIARVLYKTVILSLISKIVNNNYGFYFAILVPLAIIIVMEVSDIADERKEKKAKKKKEEDKEQEEIKEESKQEEEKQEVKEETPITEEKKEIKEEKEEIDEELI